MVELFQAKLDAANDSSVATMTFRLSTWIATLAVTFLFYATWIWLISRKLETFVMAGMSAPVPCRTSELLILGIWAATGYLAALAGWWIIQRTLRRSPGHCSSCGTRLGVTGRRCARCGVGR
ncbi:hypothetical protein [Humisphaera borealis]|uniref:Uncharacterized protein n=1 Tax=Humisphaera borealis TaxID=2807512 RepID=A0A7M2WYE7_9BACT|nr:hypothetical protein [Humisphaera borealis]QOV90496.1 hypothetical protein IPV69_03775 [Humisphaera borealis]